MQEDTIPSGCPCRRPTSARTWEPMNHVAARTRKQSCVGCQRESGQGSGIKACVECGTSQRKDPVVQMCWGTSKDKNATPIMQRKKMYKNTDVQGDSCEGLVLASGSLSNFSACVQKKQSACGAPLHGRVHSEPLTASSRAGGRPTISKRQLSGDW